MHADRVVKDFLHLLGEPDGAVCPIDLIMYIPITANTQFTSLNYYHVPWKKNMNVFKKAPVSNGVLERNVLAQRIPIGLNVGEQRQERFNFRSEVEGIVDDCIVEGLNAEAVASGEQPLPIPESECEHTSEMVQAIHSPFLIGCKNGFGVRGGPESPAGGELLEKLEIVVYLSIIANHGAVLRGHRLIAGRGKIYDCEAAVHQAAGIIKAAPRSLTVRSSMRDEMAHDRERPFQVGNGLA